MTESIVHLEPRPRNFWIFDVIALEIDSNTSLILISLIIVSAFKFEKKIFLKYFLKL